MVYIFNQDVQFLQTFILTYRLFISSHEFLAEVIARYKKHTNETQKLLTPHLFRIFNVLAYWVEFQYDDFEEDESLLKELLLFIDSIPNPNLIAPLQTAMKKTYKNQLQQAKTSEEEKRLSKRPLLANRKSAIDLSSSNSKSINNLIQPSILAKESSTSTLEGSGSRPLSIFGFKGSKNVIGGLRFIDIDPLELARQITLIEFDLFKAVKPREYLDLEWMKKDKETKAANIMRMTRWSNHIVAWLISEVVSVVDNQKTRTAIFEKIIATANVSFFNTASG